MAKTIKVTSSADLILAVRNAKILAVGLCAGSNAAVLEVFDGTQSAGSSIAKLAAVANESAPPVKPCCLITGGVSATISGTGAVGFITYE